MFNEKRISGVHVNIISGVFKKKRKKNVRSGEGTCTWVKKSVHWGEKSVHSGKKRRALGRIIQIFIFKVCT